MLMMFVYCGCVMYADDLIAVSAYRPTVWFAKGLDVNAVFTMQQTITA